MLRAWGRSLQGILPGGAVLYSEPVAHRLAASSSTTRTLEPVMDTSYKPGVEIWIRATAAPKLSSGLPLDPAPPRAARALVGWRRSRASGGRALPPHRREPPAPARRSRGTPPGAR